MGEYLELSDEELDRVEGSTAFMCMRSMLRVWLNRKEPPPTWEAVLEVVDYLDPQLASKLKQKVLTV